MLTTLTINNFVIIDQLSLEFEDGLSILTGETGAGKSILLDALGLVLGARLDGKPVGPHENKAIIVAEFHIPASHQAYTLLDEYDIPKTDSLILKRSLTNNGRNKITINDMTVSLQLLKDVGSTLIEIHTQHESHHLLDPKTHLGLLDQYGHYDQLIQDVSEFSQQIKRAEKEKAVLLAEIAETEKEASFTEFTLEEINTLAYQQDEEKELDEQCFKLKHSEKLKHALSDVEKILNTPISLADQVFKAEKTLTNFSENIDTETVTQISDLFVQANTAITEAEYQLQQLQRQLLDQETSSIEVIEERLLDLKDFAKKHKIEVGQILIYQATLEGQLTQLDTPKTRLNEINQKLEMLYQTYEKHATELHEARIKTGQLLDKAIMEEFPPLKLEKVKFHTHITKTNTHTPHPNGYDEIEFMIQTNPGSPEGSLSKIASGGEFSRIILAIKVILSQTSVTPVFIFDEVDTGIGGAVADAVGSRLEKLAEKFQLFVITHSPQVAAKADQHYHVSKIQKEHSTHTVVKNLDSYDQRLEEIARMLSGDQISEQARSAANTLMKTKQQHA